MISCDRAMLESAGAFPEDTENLINIPRSIEGVRVAVFFKSLQDGSVRVSLRSRGTWTSSRWPGRSAAAATATRPDAPSAGLRGSQVGRARAATPVAESP